MFVGVDLAADTRAALAASLAEVAIPGKPSPPQNWHITLRYIGAMDEVSIDRLVAGLDEADLGEPFTIRTGALGTFPRPERATVLWLGLTGGTDRLETVASDVDGVVDGIGFGREERPFVGHITLARIRPPEDVRRLMSGLDLPSVSARVDTVTVFESIQGAGRPEYHPIERFPLTDDR